MTTAGSPIASSPPGISHGAARDLVDLAFLGSHRIGMFFAPTAWAAAPSRSHTWIRTEFPPSPRSTIPREPGVYVFVVGTEVFGFPAATGLLYIGKATNLYERIGAYMGEKAKRLHNTRRPLVWRMLTQWNGHLRYYYTTTGSVAEAESLETEMLNALLPPFNTQYDATWGATMRAFG